MMTRETQAIEAFFAHRVTTDGWAVADAAVSFLVASSGADWMLTRSDGLGGGVFVSLKAALAEARDEAAMVTKATIIVRDRDGIESTTHFAYGRLTRPTLTTPSTARVALNG